MEASGDSIAKMEAIYTDLDAIHEKKDRYDLHWALHEAVDIHTGLTDEMERIVDDCLTSCLGGRAHSEVEAIEARLRDIDHRRSLSILHNAEYFSTLSFLVSLIDIGISVVLIVLISEIAHLGGNLLHSLILGILFVAIIAFLKVSLDRFFTIPMVRRWGWKKYLNAITISRKTMIKLNAITIIMRASVEQHDSLEEIVNLIKRGVKRI